MTADTKLKVQIRFSADEHLMYLIQQTTKQPTEYILGFFYDLCVKIGEIGADNRRGAGASIRKDLRDCYPGTSIPFKILLKGRPSRVWDPITRKYTSQDSLECEAEVGFPDKSRYVDHKTLMEKIMEKELLGGESLPDFPEPPSKTPKMYKKLIEEVLKKRN
jgi:hypothetical protein